MTSLGAEFQIRNAEWNDLPDVSAIESVVNTPIPWPRSWFEREIIRKETGFLIAEDRGNIAGYCVFWKTVPVSEILVIGVDAALRRRGVGQRLLAEVRDVLRKRGVEELHLELRTDNDVALAFYKKMGFHEVGLRKAYYRDGCDARLMTQILGETQ
jgi:ribosomal-protein-alanine N-acetyltransferase